MEEGRGLRGRAAVPGLLREAARDFLATRCERMGKHHARLDRQLFAGLQPGEPVSDQAAIDDRTLVGKALMTVNRHAFLFACNRAQATVSICALLDGFVAWAIAPAMQMQRQALEAEAHRGINALQRGDFVTARDAFATVTGSGTASPQAWLFLAQACEGLGDSTNSMVALDPIRAIRSHC
jgi:hypothetical protein